MIGTNTLRPKPLSGRRFDRLSVETYATRAEMGIAAANDVADALIKQLAAKDQVRMIFAAAPSQSEMLKALRETPGIQWDRIIAFHMDEYIGLPTGAPQRFASWLDAEVFDHLPFAAVHKITPEPDGAAEAQRYAILLGDAPIDFVCLGIGVNGHIAFNDPAVADFQDPYDVKVVDLDDICRQQQVDDQCFARFVDVPKQAITLTIPQLMRADRLFCVVPGVTKKAAVAKTLHGSQTTDCPASVLRNHPHCTLYLDKDSDPDA